MTPEATYNALPEGFEGDQRRRTEFDSAEAKLSYDAKGLIYMAKGVDRIRVLTVANVFNLRLRRDDHDPKWLRRAIASGIKNPKQVEIDFRLKSLVVDPINALSETQRTVKGRLRSGEEIAKAIPDVAAFLDAVSRRKNGKFFELNEAGQLVIKDGCWEAYGLDEDYHTARRRQKCVWYLNEQGVTQSLQGEELDTVKKVAPTMESGFPNKDEYARMNRGQLERETITWIDDNSLDASRACFADWFFCDGPGFVYWRECNANSGHRGDLGSRGVLRVNLNLES